MKQKINKEVERIVRTVEKDQSADGAWRYCLASSITLDAYMIILLRTLKINDEQLIDQLADHIRSKQEENGAWKLFRDEDKGNLSTTIVAYYALLYTGKFAKDDPRMLAAKQFILSHGGVENANFLTKVILSVTGQYPWKHHQLMPIEFILAPTFFPYNFFDLSVYARVHLVPVLILQNLAFTTKTKWSPQLTDLLLASEREVHPIPNNRFLFHSIIAEIKNLPNIPAEIKQIALRRCEQFMLERIEPDGSLYSYFTSTFLMIYAFIALGYEKDHPIIVNAINSLKANICSSDNDFYTQETDATIWNTALLSDAIQTAGLTTTSKIVERANQYLLAKQQYKYGDWAIHNRNNKPGGWGFSDTNTVNPDIDDTTAALRAIKAMSKDNATYLNAWNRGIDWVLSMQNEDGGWPAFEKNTNKKCSRSYLLKEQHM